MRWTTDPGAIPGEPYDYLDIPIREDGEIGEAKAVIVEIETPGGSRWEARAFGGKSLGTFETRLGETRSEKLFDRGRARRFFWNRKERRESGEDKCKFTEQNKRDWEEFDLCSQAFECRMILCAELRAGQRHPVCGFVVGTGAAAIAAVSDFSMVPLRQLPALYSAQLGVTCHTVTRRECAAPPGAAR